MRRQIQLVGVIHITLAHIRRATPHRPLRVNLISGPKRSTLLGDKLDLLAAVIIVAVSVVEHFGIKVGEARPNIPLRSDRAGSRQLEATHTVTTRQADIARDGVGRTSVGLLRFKYGGRQ